MGTPKRLAVVPSPTTPRCARYGLDNPPRCRYHDREAWIDAAAREALRIFGLLPDKGYGCAEFESMMHLIYREGRWPREAEWLPPTLRIVTELSNQEGATL